MDNVELEVYFKEYCKKCKYRKVKEYMDPCNECLDYPVNYNSHKPIKFEEDPKNEQ